MRLETVMYDEARNEFEEISKMDLGSEEHVKTVQAANSIADRIIKAEENEIENRKLDIEEKKIEIEKEKIKQEKRNNVVKTVLTVLTGLGTAGLYIWSQKDSQNFELNGGTHTTEAGRTSQRKLLNLFGNFKIF